MLDSVFKFLVIVPYKPNMNENVFFLEMYGSM